MPQSMNTESDGVADPQNLASAAMTLTCWSLMDNTPSHTFFIVDEASMIGSSSTADGTDLLTDLIHYVYTGHDCRLILLGDTAQLPPVGCDESPALNPDVLRSYGGQTVCLPMADGRFCGVW